MPHIPQKSVPAETLSEAVEEEEPSRFQDLLQHTRAGRKLQSSVFPQFPGISAEISADALRTAAMASPTYFQKPLTTLNSHRGFVNRPANCQYLNYVGEMEFPIDYIFADLSRHITFLPGDVVLTGTPANSRPMELGDVVEVEVTQIGRLSNTVKEVPAPTHKVVTSQPIANTSARSPSVNFKRC
jgi:hypothetical protein